MLGYCFAYLLLCNQLSPKLNEPEASISIISYSFCRPEIKEQLNWVVLAWVFSGGCMKPSSRAAVIWVFSWVWRMTCDSHGCWQKPLFLIGFGKEASVPHHVDLSRGLLKCPHIMAAGFLQSKWPGRGQENALILWPNLRSHTSLSPWCPPRTHISTKLLPLPLPSPPLLLPLPLPLSSLSYNFLPGTIPEFQTLAVHTGTSCLQILWWFTTPSRALVFCLFWLQPHFYSTGWAKVGLQFWVHKTQGLFL